MAFQTFENSKFSGGHTPGPPYMGKSTSVVCLKVERSALKVGGHRFETQNIHVPRNMIIYFI